VNPIAKRKQSVILEHKNIPTLEDAIHRHYGKNDYQFYCFFKFFTDRIVNTDYVCLHLPLASRLGDVPYPFLSCKIPHAGLWWGSIWDNNMDCSTDINKTINSIDYE